MGSSRLVELWIADGQAAGWSPRTIDARRDMMDKFAWWLHQAEHPDRSNEVSCETLRFFPAYLRDGADTGHWEDPTQNTTRAACPRRWAAPTTAVSGRSSTSWFARAAAGVPHPESHSPSDPKDQIQPFTPEQAQALVDAAKKSEPALRNTALILILLDTGLRVSELCSLTVGDVDPDTKTIRGLGKGGKRRNVYLSPQVRGALWRYLEHEQRHASVDEPLFIASRGKRTDAGLTPSGICQLFHRLGEAAGLKDVRCSPHTARHYFAITMPGRFNERV